MADPTNMLALDDLKDATVRALDALQAACPRDLPGSPPERLEAMRKRIEAMKTKLSAQ